MDRGYSIYPEPDGLIFTESWCTDLEKSAIEFAILETVELPEGVFMEIGSFEGRSSVFTANLLAGEGKVLYTIDPHEPVHYSDYEHKVYTERPIFDHFMHNMTHGTVGNYIHFPCGFEEFFEASRDTKIAYCYLDGPHGYEDVQRGLELVVPRLVPGGIVIGDDYEDAIVKASVNDFFGRDDLEHPASYRTFLWRNEA